MFCNTMKNSITIFVFAFLLQITPASAQENSTESPPAKFLSANDIIPVMAAEKSDVKIDADAITHPPLRLTPDKSEIINIDKDVGSVILGNPNHVNIMVDSPRRLIAVPRIAGASFFTVLDDDGNVLMQRHVIVASPKEKYIRIRRICTDADCQSQSVYYCPDMCHEIQMAGEESAGAQSGDAQALAESGDNMAGDAAAQALPVAAEPGSANQ